MIETVLEQDSHGHTSAIGAGENFSRLCARNCSTTSGIATEPLSALKSTVIDLGPQAESGLSHFTADRAKPIVERSELVSCSWGFGRRILSRRVGVGEQGNLRFSIDHR
jgi:hypothetical protein